MEREAAEAEPADPEARARADEHREMLRAGRGDVAAAPLHRIVGAHDSNVLCVRLWPGRDLIATGAADGTVQLTTFAGARVWRTAVASGGAVSLEWSPAAFAREAGAGAAVGAGAEAAAGASGENEGAAPSQPPPVQQRYAGGRALLAVGSMDGSVTLLDAATGGIVGAARPHSKYVVRAAFAPSGAPALATASYDGSCCLLRIVASEVADDGGGSGDDGGGGGGGGEGARLRLEVVRQAHHGAAVQDVAFLPGVAGGSSSGGGGGGVSGRVAVAVRGCSHLSVMDAATGADLPRAPLAAGGHGHGHDHAALSPLRLEPSPCRRYLLVALDGGGGGGGAGGGSSGRMLVLRTLDFSRAFSLHGLPVAQFHNHAMAWHPDSAYVYAAADGAAVFVFHVGTGRVAARLEGGHRVNVRDVHFDHARGLLATCSFDKTVRVYGAAATAAAAAAGAEVV